LFSTEITENDVTQLILIVSKRVAVSLYVSFSCKGPSTHYVPYFRTLFDPIFPSMPSNGTFPRAREIKTAPCLR